MILSSSIFLHYGLRIQSFEVVAEGSRQPFLHLVHLVFEGVVLLLLLVQHLQPPFELVVRHHYLFNGFGVPLRDLLGVVAQDRHFCYFSGEPLLYLSFHNCDDLLVHYYGLLRLQLEAHIVFEQVFVLAIITDAPPVAGPIFSFFAEVLPTGIELASTTKLNCHQYHCFFLEPSSLWQTVHLSNSYPKSRVNL